MALQQPEVPVPPAPPALPAPPAPPDPVAEPGIGGVLAGPGRVQIGSQTIEIPRNERELRALRSRRSELSNQLTNVADRRKELIAELQDAEGAARPGLEQRIQLLDQRILDLESALQRTGELVVAAPTEVFAGAPRGAGGRGGGLEGLDIAMAFVLAVLMPIALAVAWRLLRRGKAPPPSRQSAEDTQRLMRLEQAVDTIAIEVERISEGQRFVTQLMAESREPRQLQEARSLDTMEQVPR